MEAGKTFFHVECSGDKYSLMSGCSREMESKESSADISSNTEVADDVNVEESNTQEESGNDEMNEQSLKDSEMKIRVSDGENEVLYLLNDSPAAMSLYSQLPLDVEVENYGSNEKIFYPPEERIQQMELLVQDLMAHLLIFLHGVS